MYTSTKSGSMKKAARVEKKDIVMESGTFPLAQKVKRFDVVPPGDEPTRMTPIDVNSLRPAALVIKKAANGIQKNWLANPQMTA